MFFLEEIKCRREIAKRRRALKRIRESMAFFGHDTSDLTDEQIEEGFMKFCEQMKQSAFSFDDLERAFLAFKKMLETPARVPTFPRHFGR